jgi:uncharacterized protein (TIGR03546 family)
LIKSIAKLVNALNGNAKKSQIAAGFAWGLLLGLVPISNFFGIVLFIVSFFFSHNHAAKVSAMALIKFLSPLIAPSIDILGWEVLHIEALQPLFTTMFNMPFVPFTRFNNTLVMGGLAGGIVLWLPVFVAFMFLIPFYRNTLGPKIKDSKIVKAIVKFPLFKFVEKALND